MEVPLILERSFLKTDKILIDVQQGKLTLHVQDQEFTFNVFEAIKYPANNDNCYHIDVVEKLTIEKFVDENAQLPLEVWIIHSNSITEANFERKEYANYQEATTPLPNYWKHSIEELGKSSSSFIPSI